MTPMIAKKCANPRRRWRPAGLDEPTIHVQFGAGHCAIAVYAGLGCDDRVMLDFSFGRLSLSHSFLSCLQSLPSLG